MNKQGFLNLLKNPNNISETDLLGLEEIIANFPFCQTAHILAAKGASDNGQMLADKQVKKAAAYISERKNLKKILSNNDLLESPLTTPIVKEESKTPEEINSTQQVSIPVANKNEESILQPIKDIPKNLVPNEVSETNNKKEPANKSFFEELEKNLKELHSLKEKVAQTPLKKEEAIESKEDIKTEEPIQTIAEITPSKEIETPVKENIKKNNNAILFPEPIKVHDRSTTIFSSRLDEIVDTKEKSDIGSETDILLEYISYLNKNKKHPQKDKKKTENLIDKFIQADPSISKLDIKSLPEQVEDKASQSYSLKGGLVSENMANIYVLQGKKSKAIEIYEQLILKNPEKRAYFVSKIEKLK